MFTCVKNILKEKDLNLDENSLKNLVTNCNFNFNSIKENINYLKHKTDNNNIQKYISQDTNIINITNNLIYNDINENINYIFRKYNFDTNIIFLNIVENIINLTNNVNTITDIYKCILNINHWEIIKNKKYLYYSDYDIFYSIIYPLSKLKKININKCNLQYNKYISYSLQYITSINNNINVDIYYYFRKCLYNYDINKNDIFLSNFIKKYYLKKRNINSIIRLYCFLNSQKTKSYTSIINKLLK